MTASVRLSIIVVNWNTRDLIASCLSSIGSHPPGCAYEIWVVDNSSNDKSIPFLRDTFPSVQLILNGSNLGFACANNQALRRCSGEFALLLNSDTRVGPGALSALARFMMDHPGAGVAGAQLVNPDGTLQQSVRPIPTCRSELMIASGLRHDRPRTYQEPTEVEAVVGAALMARREAFDQIGLLDEGYFMYTEEVDWCFRFHEAGWKVFIVPEARVTHLDGGSSAPIALNKSLWLSQGRLRFLGQHRPAWMISATRLGLRLIGLIKTFYWTAIRVIRPAQRPRAHQKAQANWRLAKWSDR
ncbi:MAG: glycosyltransferase family 2 protein [Thermoflexales bacterium]